MNSKCCKFCYFVHGVSSTFYLLGFMFLCTVIYFNRFNFENANDSKQYMLPFLIMFFSWIFISGSEIINYFMIQKHTIGFRNFISNHILFALFLGGCYLWSIGAQLFLLNHIIILLIGIFTSYNCIMILKSYSYENYDKLETYIIEDHKKTI